MYYSLIDPNASDANFATITDHPHLYYVRMDNNHGPYQQVLFRQRVKLDWLIMDAVGAPHIEERLYVRTSVRSNRPAKMCDDS